MLYRTEHVKLHTLIHITTTSFHTLIHITSTILTIKSCIPMNFRLCVDLQEGHLSSIISRNLQRLIIGHDRCAGRWLTSLPSCHAWSWSHNVANKARTSLILSLMFSSSRLFRCSSIFDAVCVHASGHTYNVQVNILNKLWCNQNNYFRT